MNPNPTPLDEDALSGADLGRIHSALFQQLISGHAQMAVMFLGKAPNPQTGSPEEPNLEAAKMFIDQLEMLEAKTRGNLDAAETEFLRRSLTTLRLLFVETFEAMRERPAAGSGAAAPGTPAPEAPGGDDGPGGGPRFSKSYGP